MPIWFLASTWHRQKVPVIFIYILKGYVIKRIILDGTCFKELVITGNHCNVTLEEILQHSNNSNFTLLASDWSGEGSSEGGFMLYQFLEDYKINTMIVGALRFNHFSDSSYKYLSRDFSNSIENFLYTTLDQRSFVSNNFFDKVPREKFINKIDLFCNRYLSECLFYNESMRPIFFDELHLTIDGLHLFSELLPDL